MLPTSVQKSTDRVGADTLLIGIGVASLVVLLALSLAHSVWMLGLALPLMPVCYLFQKQAQTERAGMYRLQAAVHALLAQGQPAGGRLLLVPEPAE